MHDVIRKTKLKAWQLAVILGAMLALSFIVDELLKPHTYDVTMSLLLEAAIFVVVVQRPDRA